MGVIPLLFFFFSNLPNPSDRTMALGFTQLLTEIRAEPGGKERQARKAHDLIAIYEPIV
jgi:hypothetical protein